jgi:hypothetical protein
MAGVPECDGVTPEPEAGGDALYSDELEQAASDATAVAMINKRFIKHLQRHDLPRRSEKNRTRARRARTGR